MEFYEGPVASAVRAAPQEVHICSALDGEAHGCYPILGGGGGSGDGSRAVPELTPDEVTGLGYNMHVFDVWLATAPEGSGGGLVPLLPMNASSVFSSREPSALHMPDDVGEKCGAGRCIVPSSYSHIFHRAL